MAFAVVRRSRVFPYESTDNSLSKDETEKGFGDVRKENRCEIILSETESVKLLGKHSTVFWQYRLPIGGLWL